MRTGDTGTDAFGAVHRRTSADGDDGLAADLVIHLERGFDIINRGIGDRIVIDTTGHIFLF